MTDSRASGASSASNEMDATLRMRPGAAAEAASRHAAFNGLHDGTDAEGQGGHQLAVLSADERGVLPNRASTRTNGLPAAEGSARAQLAKLRHDGDEQVNVGAQGIAKLRRVAWREHADAIGTDESRAWAATMAARYGPAVKVWHNAIGWAEAYLVNRYGEDVEQWPTALGPDDTQRMAQLAANPQTGPGLTLLGKRRNRLPGETLYGLDELPPIASSDEPGATTEGATTGNAAELLVQSPPASPNAG